MIDSPINSHLLKYVIYVCIKNINNIKKQCVRINLSKSKIYLIFLVLSNIFQAT